MIAVDTNILVRFLVNDNLTHAKKAKELFERCEKDGEKIQIATIVIFELLWVLEKVYQFERIQVINAISLLSEVEVLEFENYQLISTFLAFARTEKLALPDLLIACQSKTLGAKQTYTFDRQASKSSLFKLL